MKIVIDPGHGGSDPGAVGPTGLKEKDINLKIGMKVKNILIAHGIEIQLTRDVDKFVSLDERVRIANNSKADYFVSIHTNSAINPAATGTETYAYKTGTTGDKLANSIQNSLVNEIQLANRGVKYKQLVLTSRTTMPAVLVEVAFINNPREEKLINTEHFINNAAAGIAKGILKFLNIEYKSNDDIEGVSYWAQDSMKWATSKEVGLTDGDKPKEPLTLERFITILHRYDKLKG